MHTKGVLTGSDIQALLRSTGEDSKGKPRAHPEPSSHSGSCCCTQCQQLHSGHLEELWRQGVRVLTARVPQLAAATSQLPMGSGVQWDVIGQLDGWT